MRVDLVLASNALGVLAGGNGAGKTTLLRVLGTALSPNAGTARVFGLDVRSQAARVRRLIDLVPSTGGCYPELTAVENLRFVARMRGLAVSGEEIRMVLRHVGLDHVADDQPRTFSTGMLRRLTLARLLLVRPALALLDEPYAGLDEEGRALVDALVVGMLADGRSVLVATHEQGRLEHMADVVVHLERGAVSAVKAGTPVSRSLETARVGGFV